MVLIRFSALALRLLSACCSLKYRRERDPTIPNKSKDTFLSLISCFEESLLGLK